MDDNGLKFSTGYVTNRPLDEYLAALEAIDDLPYEDLFVSDHAVKKNLYAWLALAADRTEEVGLATGVTNPYSRNPGMTAAALGTIEELSGGRSILGIGAGGHGIGPFEYDQARPVSAVRDAIAAIRRLLDGETVSVDTPAFTIEDGHLEFTPPVRDIPIFVAGRGPQLLTLAGKVADGALAGAGLSTPKGMDYARRRIATGAEEAGRDTEDVDLRCWTFLSIADDRETALDAVAPFIANLANAHASRRMLEAFGVPQEDIDCVKEPADLSAVSPAEARDVLSRDVIDLFAITGTPDTCRDRVAELAESGVDHISVLPYANEENDRLANLELFAENVVEEVHS